jgi:hypothetical protein
MKLLFADLAMNNPVALGDGLRRERTLMRGLHLADLTSGLSLRPLRACV